MRVSNKNSLDECLFSSNHEGLKYSNLNMRCSGSAALDLAYVASGRLDGFSKKLNLWDIASGILMITEAGGIVNNFSQFNANSIEIIASSGSIHDKMLENLKNFNCFIKIFCYKSCYEKRHTSKLPY